MKRIIMLTLIMFFISGCALLNPFSGTKQSTEKNFQKSLLDETVQTPVVDKEGNPIINKKGNPTIVQNTKKTFDINIVRTEKELNAWQKFCRWLGNLSILTVLIIGGSLIAGTSGPLLWLIGRFKVVSTTLKQVVAGIEKSKAVNKDPELKANLSSTMDITSKMVVDDIKRTIA